MECTDESLKKLEDATLSARREGRLEVALSLAMMREALVRDRPYSLRQSYWPIERPAFSQSGRHTVS